MKIRWYGFVMLACVFTACSNDYYTVEDFKTVPKVDTHIHISSESSAIADQAKEDNFFLLTINVDSDSTNPIDDQERYARIQVNNSPKQVAYLSTFSMNGWSTPAWEQMTIDRLKNSFEHGALGIKIWKNVGIVDKDSTGKFIMIDDPGFDKVLRTVIENKKTLLAHIGEPKNCWLPLEDMTVNNDRNYFKEHPQYHMYLHPEYPEYEDVIAARDRMLEKYPDLRVVGAHLASVEWSLDEMSKRLDRFPNLAMDMAARIPHLQYLTQKDRESVRAFFDKYQDRLIYATDMGMRGDADPEARKRELHEVWLRDWRYFVTADSLSSPSVNGDFQGLKLKKAVVDKVFRENAVRWFGISNRAE
ncbi:MAG TPA: amidohydrolase family protein [Cyclobacteriaceae bacterium]|nr:amidohydrolase family protein [Cyclobacteriaceae bacterium]